MGPIIPEFTNSRGELHKELKDLSNILRLL